MTFDTQVTFESVRQVRFKLGVLIKIALLVKQIAQHTLCDRSSCLACGCKCCHSFTSEQIQKQTKVHCVVSVC